MKLKATYIPGSSIVASSVELCDETGKLIALLIIMVPNPEFEPMGTAKLIGGMVVSALSAPQSPETDRG